MRKATRNRADTHSQYEQLNIDYEYRNLFFLFLKIWSFQTNSILSPLNYALQALLVQVSWEKCPFCTSVVVRHECLCPECRTVSDLYPCGAAFHFPTWLAKCTSGGVKTGRYIILQYLDSVNDS